MREKRVFAQRSKVLKSDEVKKKYFLVFEGEKTEHIYFDAVLSQSKTIGINPLIELIPILRGHSEHGWSNPKKLLECVISYLQEKESGCITYETLINYIMDYLYDTKIIKIGSSMASSLFESIGNVCITSMQKKLDDEIINISKEADEFLKLLDNELNISNIDKIAKFIKETIQSEVGTYDKDIDVICLIVDRDMHSFTEKQYNYVLETCKKYGFHLCVSNPCFEFWLLLHFDDIQKIDKEKLLKNEKVSKKHTYVTKELKNRYKSYNKNCYNAEKLILKIDHAIKNEKLFEQSNDRLINSVGSNIGLLIEMMRN